ncbi:MAG: hypothetical protein NTW87_11160 [Planctomycetota bacterium]|nr:hypothetical protein [Planctomycetota bacterium]
MLNIGISGHKIVKQYIFGVDDGHGFRVEVNPLTWKIVKVDLRDEAGTPPSPRPAWLSADLLISARRELCLTQNTLVPVADVVRVLVAERERHGLQYVLVGPGDARYTAQSPLEYRALVELLRNHYGGDVEIDVITTRPAARNDQE